MMRLTEEELTLRKRIINKVLDNSNLIKLINSSITTKTWSRPSIARCSTAMCMLSRTFKDKLKRRRRLSRSKLIFSGKSWKNKKWSSMTSVLEKN
jgi:hypothetical protein